MAICQLTAGIACKKNMGGKRCGGRYTVEKSASRTWARLLRIGGVYGQIRLELGEDLEDFVKLRARLGCEAHGSELAGTLR